MQLAMLRSRPSAPVRITNLVRQKGRPFRSQRTVIASSYVSQSGRGCKEMRCWAVRNSDGLPERGSDVVRAAIMFDSYEAAKTIWCRTESSGGGPSKTAYEFWTVHRTGHCRAQRDRRGRRYSTWETERRFAARESALGARAFA